jgi:RNA polymerase sigma-70 factor (ECF subfamily)
MAREQSPPERIKLATEKTCPINPEQIISLLKDKKERGMTMLYESYADSLYGLTRRILSDDQLAEDALQKSLLKIWQNISSYDPTKASFWTWMSVITRNTALDQKRLKTYQARQKTISVDEVVYKAEIRMPEGAGIDAARLLANLEENNRIVLEYAYLRGYTQQEISDSLNIPLGTVKTRLRKAVSVLRDHLKHEKDYFLGGLGANDILKILRGIRGN